MNIIAVRQEDRSRKIRQILETLKRAEEEGKRIDEDKLIMECCMEWNMSERVMKEYLKIAKWKLNKLKTL